MMESCSARHPTLDGVTCGCSAGFHPHHDSLEADVEWPNEPDNSLWEEYWRQVKLGRRKRNTLDAFLADAHEYQAEPIEVNSDRREALIAGADPRPVWIEHTLSAIQGICRERRFLSAIVVWPHCAIPTGFGGVGLMAKAFDRAVEEALCAPALHADRTPQAYAGETAPAVYALDGRKVKLPPLVPVYRSLGFNK
jgi:hypothetical protein